MANILGDDQRQRILALGRLGWPLRRIEQVTGVRRETAGAYLKAAGIAIRAPRRRRPPNSASPVSTDPAKPASEVSTDFGVGSPPLAGLPPWPPPTRRAPQASACAPYRKLIELSRSISRKAWACVSAGMEWRGRRPLFHHADMTSAVKYHDDAGIGRAVTSSGLVPDFVGAGAIVRNAMGLWGGIPR